MPIEIKELHIRVAVTTPKSGQSSGAQTAAAGGGGSAVTNDAKEAIVAECVEQVLQIIKSKAER